MSALDDTQASPGVIVAVEGRVGRLRLDRPRAIHALDMAMVGTMTDALAAWIDDPAIDAVLIDHASGRGFCAGGDIRMLAASGAVDGSAARTFFHAEYRLNHLLHSYPKPVIAMMDGITMGGGVGIALPASVRVATENTRLAMPETGIGLFPDVGGGWYLPRLEGHVGRFLALTGARLDGAECFALGIATHHLAAERLDEAVTRIIANPDRAGGILGDLSVAPPPARILANLSDINRLFSHQGVPAILDALDADGSDWAAREAATLRAKSPTSCAVALAQLDAGAAMPDFAANMALEYAIAGRMAQHPDFIEGVRALIIDKDNAPVWTPADHAAVDPAAIADIVAPSSDADRWTPHPATCTPETAR